MLTTNKGFTLIEIIIVVAIIGILATFAASSYSEYVIKSRLVEIINLGAGNKANLLEYYLEHNACPDNSKGPVGGFAAAGDYVGHLAIRMRVNSSSKTFDAGNGHMVTSVCLISTTVNGDKKTPKAIRDKSIRIRMALPPSGVIWQCSVDPESSGGISFKYLPMVCRNY